MASKMIEITLEWENDKFFEMKSRAKEEKGPWGESFTIFRADENTSLNNVWDKVTGICLDYFRRRFEKIGYEMGK